jgi:hypothetical protein
MFSTLFVRCSQIIDAVNLELQLCFKQNHFILEAAMFKKLNTVCSEIKGKKQGNNGKSLMMLVQSAEQ